MQLSWIRDGIETSLDDGSLCYYQSSSGLGLPPLHRLSERGPQQHGDTDRGYRLDPRIIQLVLATHSSVGADDLDEKSRRLMQLFSPDSYGTLKIVRGARVRQIDAYFVSGLSLDSNDRSGWVEQHGLALKANDPAFYDPSVESVTFQLGGGGTAWEIPMPVPFTVGASVIDQAITVGYDGKWYGYPHLIRITGPIDDCLLENQTTAEKLDFTGTTINAGEYYDIDLRPGHKTVIDHTGANVISALTEDSDLSTWHLNIADSQGAGKNSIRVTGNNVTSATKIELAYYIRDLSS